MGQLCLLDRNLNSPVRGENIQAYYYLTVRMDRLIGGKTRISYLGGGRLYIASALNICKNHKVETSLLWSAEVDITSWQDGGVDTN